MTLSITERDKKLLLIVTCAVIILIAFQYMILPTANIKAELDSELEELTLLKQEREMKLKALKDIDAKIAANLKALDSQKQNYYEYLQTREVDTIITNLALSHGLFPRSMLLTESGSASVPDYIHFSPATKRVIKTPFYVHIGAARIEVDGSVEQWTAFMDEINQSYPSIRITSFESGEIAYVQDTDQTVFTNHITADLEIYMCFADEF